MDTCHIPLKRKRSWASDTVWVRHEGQQQALSRDSLRRGTCRRREMERNRRLEIRAHDNFPQSLQVQRRKTPRMLGLSQNTRKERDGQPLPGPLLRGRVSANDCDVIPFHTGLLITYPSPRARGSHHQKSHCSSLGPK